MRLWRRCPRRLEAVSWQLTCVACSRLAQQSFYSLIACVKPPARWGNFPHFNHSFPCLLCWLLHKRRPDKLVLVWRRLLFHACCVQISLPQTKCHMHSR